MKQKTKITSLQEQIDWIDNISKFHKIYYKEES
jgi:hypothetical protein